MAYIDFKALVKKVNLKPKGVKEIVLEVTDTSLDGNLNSLSEMIDLRAEVQLESLVINYNVTVDMKTNEPVINYKVDSNGVVQEVKKENDQLEADLGLPEELRTKEEEMEIEKELINNFIIEGMAPNFNEFPIDFVEVMKRKIKGESFSKLAFELDMSSGKIAELMDSYCEKVAPLAKAWSDWKDSSFLINQEKQDLSSREDDEAIDEDEAV